MTTEPVGKVREVALSELLMDPALQVRRKLDRTAVKKYLSRYRAGGKMPPLRVAKVNKGALVLLDGWHRVAALEALGRTRAKVEIFEMSSRDAWWEAARSNLQHGVPFRSQEYRHVFRAYIRARKHRGASGNLKSYREIADDIGGTKGHTTVRNWMRRDFPKIAAEMSEDAPGSGGLRDTTATHPEDDLLASGMRAAENAMAAARGIRDPIRRGKLIEALRGAVRKVEQAGPYEIEEDF